MDEQERYDKERREREEEDRAIRQKMSEEVGKLYNAIEKKAEGLYKHVETLENRLEKRDREIENESRDRDATHDKSLVTIDGQVKNLEKDLTEHVKNDRVHKKLRSMDTIQAEQLPPNWRSALTPPQPPQPPQPPPDVHQSQPIPSQPAQSDEWSAKGVPWWANPKWLTAIGTALAAIITAVAIALSHLKKEDKLPPEKPEKSKPAATADP